MRVFVAVEVNDSEVITSIRKLQKELNVQAKPIETQNLHFTLQFLGEVNEDRIQEIKSILDSISFSPFVVRFLGIGAFPRSKDPRVIWVGTDEEGGKNLVKLAKKVESTLEPLGFKTDKPFKPHITIFRVKKRHININDQLNKFQTCEFGSQEISKMKLKESTLTSQGPIYSDLLTIRGK
ncbi:MAG: RNA 2',3'-cyclic phosphodiesterase [Nitrosopumilaceae archaeon]|nr:RNA 2',3'-cyclic phosphodiesterase [Nitrosopumilaceae archaeon]NIU00870.1 RNA 2',3'-cyclic phosphodiesterase [Nitrosopumilaceae archaeon]NIU87323.1 RNA 2',3'-cyclic phosphodiesterase [Nitrosopumilaceae archaeon]NIV65851.1 RNA 2',3'-cyclic phosphodiesterase [Nitrosopumilaceae archaeon]NIX61472.1 RNA 2',3'-cyclic phosphodiesterase [Nitrosopumilaceae archaeon]